MRFTLSLEQPAILHLEIINTLSAVYLISNIVVRFKIQSGECLVGRDCRAPMVGKTVKIADKKGTSFINTRRLL